MRLRKYIMRQILSLRSCHKIVLLLLFNVLLPSHVTHSFIVTLSQQQSFHNKQRRIISNLYMGVRGKKIRKEIREEKEMETPPRINTPYGPIRFNRPLTMCDICIGLGKVYCNVCMKPFFWMLKKNI